MAATSHDFWLKNMTAPVWKRNHMFVYAAYALLVGHVTLGALQSETSPILAILMGAGTRDLGDSARGVWAKERRVDQARAQATAEGFVEVCDVTTFLKSAPKVVTPGTSASRSSSTTERFPPFRTCVHIKADRWAKAG
jgi:hypothetical protein